MSPVLGNGEVSTQFRLDSKVLIPGQALISPKIGEIKTTSKTDGALSFSKLINTHQQCWGHEVFPGDVAVLPFFKQNKTKKEKWTPNQKHNPTAITLEAKEDKRPQWLKSFENTSLHT